MGNLYLARARGIEGFERLVVLKRLKPDVAARYENVRSFLDEVRVLASMQHDNVVHIYDVGVAKDGSYFYSMEFLVGQDLRRLMLRGARQGQAFPLPQAIFVASSVLSGLHHVHQRLSPNGEALRIVHRDVSPANIFITYEGGVKLIDFGIVKTAHQSIHTEQGVLKGKIRYMSPEQCRMEPMDAKSDIFSLGVVLWEMTTGRALFKNQNSYEALVTIAEKDAPRPSLAVAEYPSDLEAVVMKALARRVADRWQSAKEMQLALAEVAVRRHWPLSSFGLSELMEARFAQELDALRGSRAAGQELADFAVRELVDAAPTPSAMSARRVTPAVAGLDTPSPTAPPPSAIVPVGPRATPRLARRARPGHRRSWAAAAIIGLLAIGVGIRFVSGTGRQPPPAEQKAAEEPVPVTAFALPLEVSPPPPEDDALDLAPLPTLPASRPRPVGPALPQGDEARRRAAPARHVASWNSDSPFPPP
jgi:serine/threonine protein kinase